MIVRKAIKADMPEVLNLIKELALFEKEPTAVEISVETLETEGFGDNPLFQCFVATSEEVIENDTRTSGSAEATHHIVGAAIVYYRFSTWKGRTLHLEDLIVTESMRGKGFGEGLYAEVMNFAHSQGLKRVAWDVLDWNTGAIKFYERSGANIMAEWRVVHMDEKGLNNYMN